MKDSSVMETMSPELRAAIDVAKERVKVDNYFVFGMNKGLKGHAQGLWAGTILGAGTGALGGAFVSAALIAASVSSGLIGLPLILGMAGLGTVAGATVGSRIGSATGAVAGVVGEFERRTKAEKLEAEILASPEKQADVIRAYRDDPVVEKDNTVGEALATTRDPLKAWKKICDPVNLLLTTALCAVAGMVIFAGAFLLASGGALALAGPVGIGIPGVAISHIGAALGIGAAVGSMSGVSFGITYPMIFASLTKETSDILAQKAIKGESGYAPVKTVQQMEEKAVSVSAASERMPSNVIQFVRRDEQKLATSAPETGPQI